MSTSKWWFLSLVLAALCGWMQSAGAADLDEAVKKELADLAGQWDFQGGGASGEGYRQPFYFGGREAGNDFGLYVLNVNGDTFTFAATKAGTVTAKIDPTRTPKTIDFTNSKGTWLGVYELKGDNLVITLAVRKTRPRKVVEDNVPSGQAYAIYKRASK